MKTWRTVQSRVIFQHPRLTLIEDDIELPGGKIVPYLKFAPNAGAAAVIAQRGHEILVSREYSYPPDEILYQFPGGGIEAGEQPEAAARRELIEETGYKAGTMESLGWYYFDNRRSNTKMYVFLATDVQAGKQEGGDLEEDIESKWIPIQTISDLIRRGEIVNVHLLAAWSLFTEYAQSNV